MSLIVNDINRLKKNKKHPANTKIVNNLILITFITLAKRLTLKCIYNTKQNRTMNKNGK